MTARFTGPGHKAVRGNDAASHPRLSEYISKARKVTGILINQMKLGEIWSGVRYARIADDAVVKVQIFNNIDGLEPIVNMELFIEREPVEEDEQEVATVFLAAFVARIKYDDPASDYIALYPKGGSYYIAPYSETSSYQPADSSAAKPYGDEYGLLQAIGLDHDPPLYPSRMHWQRNISAIGEQEQLEGVSKDIVSWRINGSSKYLCAAFGNVVWVNNDPSIELPSDVGTVLGAAMRSNEGKDYVIAVAWDDRTLTLLQTEYAEDVGISWATLDTLELPIPEEQTLDTTSVRGSLIFNGAADSAVGTVSLQSFYRPDPNQVSDTIRYTSNFIVRVSGDSFSVEGKNHETLAGAVLSRYASDSGENNNLGGTSTSATYYAGPFGIDSYDVENREVQDADYKYAVAADWVEQIDPDTEETVEVESIAYFDFNNVKTITAKPYRTASNTNYRSPTGAKPRFATDEDSEVFDSYGGVVGSLVVENDGVEKFRIILRSVEGNHTFTGSAEYSDAVAVLDEEEGIYQATQDLSGEAAVTGAYSYYDILSICHLDLVAEELVFLFVDYSATVSGSASGSNTTSEIVETVFGEDNAYPNSSIGVTFTGSSNHNINYEEGVARYKGWDAASQILHKKVGSVSGIKEDFASASATYSANFDNYRVNVLIPNEVADGVINDTVSTESLLFDFFLQNDRVGSYVKYIGQDAGGYFKAGEVLQAESRGLRYDGDTLLFLDVGLPDTVNDTVFSDYYKVFLDGEDITERMDIISSVPYALYATLAKPEEDI